MEINQDYLLTGTAISSRAFHEHWLRLLVNLLVMRSYTTTANVVRMHIYIGY